MHSADPSVGACSLLVSSQFFRIIFSCHCARVFLRTRSAHKFRMFCVIRFWTNRTSISFVSLTNYAKRKEIFVIVLFMQCKNFIKISHYSKRANATQEEQQKRTHKNAQLSAFVFAAHGRQTITTLVHDVDDDCE